MLDGFRVLELAATSFNKSHKTSREIAPLPSAFANVMVDIWRIRLDMSVEKKVNAMRLWFTLKYILFILMKLIMSLPFLNIYSPPLTHKI